MKQYFLLCISVGIAIGAASGLLFMVHDIQRNTAQISETTGLLKAVSERDTRARALEEFIERVRPLKTSLDAYVVGADDIVSAIELVEETARREGVNLSLSAVTIVSDDEWEYHEGIEVSLTAIGTFSNLAAFAAALESLPRAARIDEVHIEASVEESWFGRFTVVFIKEIHE